MSPPDDASLRASTLTDEHAIKRILLRWCRAIDRLDLAAIPDLFHPDAEDDHVFYKGDIPGLVDALAKRHEKISFSCHQLGNVLIEFIKPGLAIAESYVQVTQHVQTATPGCSDVQTSWCRYIDTFESRLGTWRISHRLLVIDAASEHALAPGQVFSVPAGNTARRDQSDPVFVARRRLLSRINADT